MHTGEMGESQQKIFFFIFGTIVALIAIVAILVPMSFVPLEYYQFGFKRRKSTGAVDTSKVYGKGGRWPFGPDYEFKTFPADVHFESFSSITVFASDRLQVEISCFLQYFIRMEQLHLLHKNYDIHYKPVLRNNALDALKGAATAFSTREYIRERNLVEEALFKAVKERLGGSCCEINCGELTRPCTEGCTPLSQCTVDDFGLFSDVRFFQLTAVEIPEELNLRFLQALVLQEATQTETQLQLAQVIRKETDALVQGILNTAAEINQNATATSNLIASKAEADAKATTEKARSDGLKLLYTQLGITSNEHRASFDYLRTLRGQKNAIITVDYQQLITGGLN